MRMIHESPRRPKKLAAASGLALALTALTAAGAQAAAVVTPHSATHTISPAEVHAAPAPQPGAPSTTAGPSLPAAPGPNLPAPPPSSSNQQMTGGNGFSPSKAAAYAAGGSPSNDVGHNAGQQQVSDQSDESPIANGEWLVGFMQGLVDTMEANLQNGEFVENRFGVLFTLARTQDLLQHAQEVLKGMQREEELSKPEVAVRDVLGYSEVTGEPCGADFQTLNEDDNQSNNIAFC
jgi:opacity protein-like surface antigen